MQITSCLLFEHILSKEYIVVIKIRLYDLDNMHVFGIPGGVAPAVGKLHEHSAPDRLVGWFLMAQGPRKDMMRQTG